MHPIAKPTKEEEDFMKALFADLDERVFNSDPSPSPVSVKLTPKKNIHVGIRNDASLSESTSSPNVQNDKGPSGCIALQESANKSESVRVLDMDALCEGAESWDWNDMEIDLDQATTETVVLNNYPPPPQLIRPICTRCKVLEVLYSEFSTKRLLVKVDGKGDNHRREVILQQDWVQTDVVAGDIINILGEFTSYAAPSSSSSNITLTITIDSRSGMLILQPDLLLSATTIANAPSCTRRPLISLMLASNAPSPPSSTPEASPVPNSPGEAVVWGNFLHEVMQKCLAAGTWDKKSVEDNIENVVRSPNGLRELVKLGVGIERARSEVRARSGGLYEFSHRYVGCDIKPTGKLSDSRDTSDSASRLAITSLYEVEEDIWSPTYGIKGKLDASLQALVQEELQGLKNYRTSNTRMWSLPFEIKTGRAIAVLEHRAQTLLYTLLMAERYDVEVPSGLLYYTHSEELIRVPAARNEVKALLIARNELASYMMRKRILNDDSDQHVQPLLPPTLDDGYKCKKCYVVNGCMLYRKAIENVQDDFSPISELYSKRTSHLTQAQCDFFKKWETLVSMEEQDVVRFRKELWTMNAEDREKKGRCFAKMVVQDYKRDDTPGVARMHQHIYKFVRATGSSNLTHPISSQLADGSMTLLNGSMSTGDAVTVSLDPDLIAIARGFIIELDPDHITIGFDHEVDFNRILQRSRPAIPRSSCIICRIDKDEFGSGLGRIRDNLARLFYLNGDVKRLSLVVDLASPQFDDDLFLDESEVPSHLNVNQQDAVRKVLTAKDYAIILGMPGTGKTSTIAEIINVLVKRGKTVLLASYTHSAVDAILLKLKDAEYPILRLGSLEKVHPEVHKFTLSHQAHPTTVEQLEHQILRPPVVATTCLSVDHRDACRGGLDVSLFKRLVDAHPQAVVDLVYQYRMNSDIMLLSNKLIYSGRLRCGSKTVAERAFVLPNRKALRSWCKNTCQIKPCWIKTLLEENCKAVFVDTDKVPAQEDHVGDLIQNDVEARLVCQLIEALTHCGVAEDQIGVISLYRQQIKLLSHLLHLHKGIELLTADRSQGRDKDCIIISMVKSNTSGQIGDLLKDWRRINVSFTRARSKLIIFGSRSTLRSAPVMAEFFDLVESRGWVLSLEPGCHTLHERSVEPTPSAPMPVVPPPKRPANLDDNKENLASNPLQRRAKKAKTEQGILKGRPMLRDIMNGLA
ncbi:Dna2-domain-containing protein [Hysterangium stoloniferum]|nr:Dna2-domain-containing protein [Hysterangium stoloniferum]